MSRKVAEDKKNLLQCVYCSQSCETELWKDGEVFCCHGCMTLHSAGDNFKNILEQANDHALYKQYDFPELFNSLVDFQNNEKYTVSVKLPEIHCSSCVRILEDLPNLVDKIEVCKVNFETKIVYLRVFKTLSISKLFYILDKIGYPPNIDLDQKKTKNKKLTKQKELIKLAVAGFAFGNIMLFSIPHYFGLSIESDPFFSVVFKILNVALSFAVLYAGSSYLTSASKALSMRKSHIDIPIALGIMALWGWSMYEILAQIGFGYMDSLAALVFFLLVGKWFQSKVYEKVSFERSLTEFMPLVTRKKNGKTYNWTKVQNLSPGDIISVKNGETIPVNGILLSKTAHIDYSFVTGESKINELTQNGRIYVGAKVIGPKIDIAITEKPDINKLWSAWKSPKEKKESSPQWTITVGKYFTIVVLLLALIGTITWLFINPSKALFVGVAVLIVACPCALALSAPFTYGSAWTIFSKNGLYLKSTNMVGLLSEVSHILFDKTGTLTARNGLKASFSGNALTNSEKHLIHALCLNSNHPMSKTIARHLKVASNKIHFEDFKEIEGEGMQASINSTQIRMGSKHFLHVDTHSRKSAVHLEIKGKYRGYFELNNSYRNGLNYFFAKLKKFYKLSVLSGDNSSEKLELDKVFNQFDFVGFSKKPEEKKQFVQQLAEKEESTMMIGDGLNDQIAIKQSNIGVVVTDSISGFYPSADGVMLSDSFILLPKIMDLGRFAKNVLKICLGFSLFYNLIGLSYALSGALTPLIAAILMPISSISVVVLSTVLIRFKAKKLKLI